MAGGGVMTGLGLSTSSTADLMVGGIAGGAAGDVGS